MFCSNCGQPLNENDRFCAECGTPVERHAAEQAVAEQTVEAVSVEEPSGAKTETPIEPQPEPAAKPKKKSHKALWIVLTCVAAAAALLTALLLWRSWRNNSRIPDLPVTPAPVAETPTPEPTEAPTPEPTEAPTPEPTQSPEEILGAAFQQNRSAQSMHMDLHETVVMSVGVPAANYAQNMEVALVFGMDVQKEPDVVRTEGKITLPGQTQEVLLYSEEIDGVQWTYTSTNGGRTWSRQKAEQDGGSMLSDPEYMTEQWIENAKDFERTGEETVNGCAATVYSGTLAGKFVKDAVSMTGTTADDDVIKDLDDLPFTIWIDNDSGRIVRMRIDLQNMMQKLMEASMKDSLSQMGDAEVTVGIETAEVVCDISQFDAIEEIVIPDEARGRGAAGIPAGEGVVGTWYLCGGEDEESQQYVDAILAFGMDMTMTFNEDGTGVFALFYAGESEEEAFTYTYEDGKLILEDDETLCRVEDGKLYFDMDNAKLVFERR